MRVSFDLSSATVSARCGQAMSNAFTSSHSSSSFRMMDTTSSGSDPRRSNFAFMVATGGCFRSLRTAASVTRTDTKKKRKESRSPSLGRRARTYKRQPVRTRMYHSLNELRSFHKEDEAATKSELL